MDFCIAIGNSAGVSYERTGDPVFIRKVIEYWERVGGHRITVWELDANGQPHKKRRLGEFREAEKEDA